MKSDFPIDLITSNGRRKPKQLRNIIKNYPLFWQQCLVNTDDNLTDKERYELYWIGLFTYKECITEHCNNKVIKNPKGEFCSTSCMHSSGIVQKRIESTCIDRFGCTSSLGNQEVREKGCRTSLDRYGVTNGGWSIQSQAKIKQSCMERYGSDSPGGASIIRDKINNTLQEKYNANTPFADKQIQNQIKNTNMIKYGVQNIFQLDKFRNKQKSMNTKSSKFNFEILADKQHINSLLYTVGWKGVADLIGYKNTSHSQTYKQLRRHNIQTLPRSLPELEIKQFIESFDIKVIHNSRKIISPYELDLYIPSHNLAIEYNGLYWHSSHTEETDHQFKNKHINKTKLCNEKGIQLLHIFENEWIEHKDVWMSIIKSKMNLDNNIDGSHCSLQCIDNNIAYNFIKDNHFQYIHEFEYAKGILYNNELVMVITFMEDHILNVCSKLDITIQNWSIHLDKSYTIEIDRRFHFNEYNFGELISISSPKLWYTNGNKLSHINKENSSKIWDAGYFLYKLN